MSSPTDAVAGEADIIRVLAELAALAAAAPTGAPFSFHPGDDARVMRDIARASGAHAAAGVRIWRALCGEYMRAGGLRQVVIAGGDAVTAVATARGYFGFSVPFVQVADIREALERALDSSDQLACLPWPEQAGAGQWWPMLNESRFRDLSILAGWPGFPAGSGAPVAAIVGRAARSSSGSDETLLTAHDDLHKAERLMADAGLPAEVAARARSLTLIKVAAYVEEGDLRLETARRSGLEGLRIVGVRPCP
jgi:hypothetical protein